ncbi:amidase [Roseovarius sp.]|uniref:amidase n=1 Tax=Roseovarius sp. TaxID=1486281 RepID=UPI003A9815C9
MVSENLWAYDATAMAQLVRTGATTSEALMRACLERIAERDPSIAAWEFLDPNMALAAARACDAAPAKGPLHGVPVAIKDIIDTAEMPTGYGSLIYSGHRPAADANCVSALRAAGAVIMGKTVTTEFATFRPGKTHNPHNYAHTPGGSSSGSAAAVASGMAPIALGTQTVGSVIRPAAFCGTVGFKATQGLLELTGVKPLASSLDSLGCFTRSVRDAALWFSVQSGHAPAPRRTRLPKVAMVRSAQWHEARAESRTAVESAAATLRHAGISVTEPVLPEAFNTLVECQNIVFSRGARVALAQEWADHRGALSPQLVQVLAYGDSISDSVLAEAEKTAAACRRVLEGLFQEVDLILTPAAPGEAPHGLAATGDPLFNRTWTLMLGPCATLPSATGPTGLPVGIQLVGPRNGDAAFLDDVGVIAERLGLGLGVSPV